jgi:hypothetical protein
MRKRRKGERKEEKEREKEGGVERCIEREKGKKEILIKMPSMPPTPPALQIRVNRRKSEEILQPHTTEVYSTAKTKKNTWNSYISLIPVT